MPTLSAGDPDELQLRLGLQIANREEIKREAAEVEAVAQHALATVQMAQAQSAGMSFLPASNLIPASTLSAQSSLSVARPVPYQPSIMPSISAPPGVSNRRVFATSFGYEPPHASSVFHRGEHKITHHAKRMVRGMMMGYAAQELIEGLSGDELTPNHDMNGIQMLGQIGGSAIAYGAMMGPQGVILGAVVGSFRVMEKQLEEFKKHVEERLNEELKHREELFKALHFLEEVQAHLESRSGEEIHKLVEEKYLGFRDVRN